MTTIKARIKRLEAQATVCGVGDYPPYQSAVIEDELHRQLAALPADWRGKCYIGVSPDDWDTPERAKTGAD